MPARADAVALHELPEQIANEPSAAARRRLLLAHREAWLPELVTRLFDQVLRLAHSNIRQAERVAHAADWLASRLADPGSSALAFRATGHIHFLRRKYAPAWERYQAALRIYEQEGEEVEAGRTLNASLSALMYLGRYDEALAAAKKAREIFSKHGDRLRLARLDTNTANLLNRQGRYQEALELYEQAYEAFVEIGEPTDVAVTLRNLATCRINLNDFERALETHEQARAYCEYHRMPLLRSEADYNIAYLYYLRGEYTRALELYRIVRDRCEAAGDGYHQALCNLDQSEMLLELNLAEEGQHLAKAALDGFRHLRMGYEAAKALTNLAVSANRQGNSREALRLFRKAGTLFTRERNRPWMATIDLYQALVSFESGEFSEALRLCQRASEYLEGSPLRGKFALCQLLRARIRLALGEAADAKAICLAVQAVVERSELPVLQYQTWFVLGSAEEELGRPDAAYEAYLKAHEWLENLRTGLHVEELCIGFLKDKLAVYEALVRLCLAKGPSHDHIAFRYVERAKSRALADLITFRPNRKVIARTPGAGLNARIRELRESVNWHTRTIRRLEEQSDVQDNPQLPMLRRAAREREQQLLHALTQLKTEDAHFANLQQAASLEVEEICSAVPEDALLVEYYSVRGVMHAFLLSREGLKTAVLGPDAELRSRLEMLSFQISKCRLHQDYVRGNHYQLLAAVNAHLEACYRMLLAPVESELRASHLIIAPHGLLHQLPFHALFDGERYLSQRFSISYTPSGSIYYLCSRKERATSGGSLVLGLSDAFAPHIRDEVEAVASVLPGAEVFEGEAATREAFQTRAPQSRWIHIASHGRFRPDSPMFSSIDLADGPISLLDLYEMQLSAELVTLSGCGTGLNVVVGGDELMGLVRGLLYAGAQSAMGTLWDVNDGTTAEFMKRFYQHLRSGRNKGNAVRQAMADVRERYPHPFYWAPFVLVGQYQ